MPTFARNNKNADAGFTLAELLVALAILSFASLIVASAFNARSSGLVVDRAAEALVVDLKRLRLLAEMRGQPIELVGASDGYRAKVEGVEGRFPKGVTARWNDETEAVLSISSEPGQTGVEIRLAKSDSEAIVRIAPATGRIALVR